MSVKACLRFFNVFSYDKKNVSCCLGSESQKTCILKGVFKVCGGEGFGKWFARAAGAIG